jgi:2-phosphoglycerate kinase
VSSRHFVDPLPLGEPGGLPYSKGLMARALVVAGVPIEHAYLIAKQLELDVGDEEPQTVPIERLDELAAEILGPDEGPRIVSRLRGFAALQTLDMPIVLLVGGATGTGKSTVATEVAHRLGITRVTSTDFIRETMRAFFSPRSMPSVHHSSFDGDPALDAFVSQTRNVVVGVEAAIERAMTESWSMVLEGVHLVPGLVPSDIEGALVVHVVLAVESERVHRTHFHLRDHVTGGVRPMDKYLDCLDEIRVIQDYLVERAERFGVTVIESSNVERAAISVLELVLSSADRSGAFAHG